VNLAEARSTVRYSLNKNKYLLAPERERLEKIIDDYMEKNTRDCLMLLLALKTGARAQELLNIKIEDINRYDESILIRGIKGSNDREIPISSKIFQRLIRYMNSQQANKLAHEPLFDISYNRLYQIWEFYRPVHKKFHSLRHTFAIELYQKTKDLRLVQVALGHRNITNTMVYADYVYNQQELRRLIL
jgi:integrase